MALLVCMCQCHAESRLADAQELRQKGHTASAWVMEMEAIGHPRGPSTSDYVACVLACDTCRPFHRPVLDAPPKKDEWVDPPRPPRPATGFDGEGEEV